MNPRMIGRSYVGFTHPVTGEDDLVPASSPLGRAVLALNVREVIRLHRQATLALELQDRIAEISGPVGIRSAWATIANHAAEHGREFRVLLMAVVP